MKKDTSFEWDESCRLAFQSIKDYLMQPAVLTAPVPRKPLLLYIVAQEKSLGTLLAQTNDQGKDHSLYYLSRMMVRVERNYSQIEKTCLALIFIVQKLRHYLIMLSEWLAKRVLLLSEFEVNFVPQKAIKGQALANFLANHPIPTEREVNEKLPDEEIFYIEVLPPWKMYFDGATRKNDARADIFFISPNDDLMLYFVVLSHYCTNNEVEYQARILGLGMTIEIGLTQLEIFGDSALVIRQLIGDFEVRKEKIAPYHKKPQRLLEKILNVTLRHVPRVYNSQADTLARITARLAQFDTRLERIPVCERWVCVSKEEEQISLAEAHGGICGAHQGGPKLHLQVKQLGYYWPTMLRDAMELARHCTISQLHANYIHQPPNSLHLTVASWPFEAWGMDIISPITPKSSANHL
ncbi:hypothetical protein H6P81_009301 [Aristolochia fimbriata]|uniref:Uncharacterized protein n=1 Tax=Aristolochia fimbriata TaxID=158543 RepID=A0AAV7EN77_ARIFI|nr:hypothetical protein H6P81_009301 [Aristolochia fimbriata]